jgi:hypothetical protein
MNKMLYGYNTIGDKRKLIDFNFWHSVISTGELLAVVRWNDDDAIAHDPLRMRITNLT